MKLPFTLRDPPVQANFDKLAGGLDFNHVKVSRVTFTWPGGTMLSSNLTVVHGLGSAPTGVVFGANSASLGAHAPFCFADPDRVGVYLQSLMLVGTAPTAGSTAQAWVAVFA